MKIADEAELDDTSRLIAVTGMTPEQFAERTAVMRGIEAPEEDEMPGAMVMRGDYDTVRNAIANENEELAGLTDANRTVADAMVAIAHGARMFCRHRGVEQPELALVSSTQTALIFRVERAA